MKTTKKVKEGKVFRDAKDRIGIKIGSQIVRLIGDIDCEYRRTNLINVKTKKRSGGPGR